VKLGLDWGTIAASDHPALLFLFVGGAGFAHLSFGMAHFRIAGSGKVLILSQLMRIAADLLIVRVTWGDKSDWQFLMLGDFCWLMVMFLLRFLSAVVASSEKAAERATVKQAASNGERRLSYCEPQVLAASTPAANAAAAAAITRRTMLHVCLHPSCFFPWCPDNTFCHSFPACSTCTAGGRLVGGSQSSTWRRRRR